MCLFPKLIDNPKYRKNKKNGGIVPPLKDKRAKLVPVGCGKCMECSKQRMRAWQVRLTEEIRNTKNGKFITFSFSDKSLIELEEKYLKIKVRSGIKKSITMKNGKKRNYYNYEEKKLNHKLYGYDLDNAIAKKGVRLFLERWRKETGKSVRHWLVTELGTKNTERIHLHGFLFTDQNKEFIEKIWSYGNVFIGTYVNEKSVNYMVKYISKSDAIHKEYKPIVCTSSGIGSNYLKRIDSENNQYNGEDTKEYYRTRARLKLALPIYYRNYIYTEDEREDLWMMKLDKQERYVLGKKIDISENEDVYYKRLEEARVTNKFHGYGNDSINWKRRKYENERRNLKKLERYAKYNVGQKR